MPPKTKKATPSIDTNSDESIVLQYLTVNNRPFNANDIHSNLHGKVGKTVLIRILTQLADKQHIVAKACGKQTLYVVNQSNIHVPPKEELIEMDTAIESLRERVIKLKERNRILSNELVQASSTLSYEQIKARIQFLTDEISRKQDRLSKAKNNLASETDIKNKELYKKRRQLYSKLYSERKNSCLGVMSSLSENIENCDDVFEQLGLQLDPKNKKQKSK